MRLLMYAGLTKEVLDVYGMGLDQALVTLRNHLPRNAILVRVQHIWPAPMAEAVPASTA
jgi:hypothetical protein